MKNKRIITYENDVKYSTATAANGEYNKIFQLNTILFYFISFRFISFLVRLQYYFFSQSHLENFFFNENNQIIYFFIIKFRKHSTCEYEWIWYETCFNLTQNCAFYKLQYVQREYSIQNTFQIEDEIYCPFFIDIAF